MNRALLKLGIFIAVILSAALIVRSYGISVEALSMEKLKTSIEGFGLLAPVVFILFYAIAPLLLFPGSALTIAGGLLFGWLIGGVYVVIGANLGANAAFLLARFLGREFVERLARGKAEKVQAFIEREGFSAVLLLRLIPIVPFNILNYAAGLSPVRWMNYFLATLIGMIPGIFVFVYLGGNLDPRTPSFWVAMVLLIILSAVPLLYRRYAKKSEQPF